MRSPEVLLQCVEAEIGEFGAEELDHMLLSVCCPPPPPHPARVARSLGQVHEVYCGHLSLRPSLSLPASDVADGPAHQVPSFPSIRFSVAAKRRGEQASPRVASLLRVAAGHLMHVEDISLHARRYLLVRGGKGSPTYMPPFCGEGTCPGSSQRAFSYP